jgi:DNA-binding HxlR family transcriptional regulator
MRLAIVSALVASDVLSFTDLKTQLGMTDGNLALHVRRLEEAGYLASQKVLEGRMPHTEYRLTAAGRKALDRYLAHMEALIREIRGKG